MTDAFCFQLSINIPSGQQYEKGDMLNIRGNDPVQFEAALDAITAQVAEKAANAANALKAAYAAIAGIPGASVESEQMGQSAPPQNNAWGGQQQQSPPQNNGGGQSTDKMGRPFDPSGATCQQCNSRLVIDKTKNGKQHTKCPEYKYANGASNGHTINWG